MTPESCHAAARLSVARPFLTAHLERQRAFSLRTFGPGERTAGVVAHIRKELAEIAADPDDVVEYADVVILAFDGAMRAGHAPAAVADAFLVTLARNEGNAYVAFAVEDAARAPQDVKAWALVAARACEAGALRGFLRSAVLAAVIDKQARNESRTWPDWRSLPADAPIEHVKGPADLLAEFMPTVVRRAPSRRVGVVEFNKHLRDWCAQHDRPVPSVKSVADAMFRAGFSREKWGGRLFWRGLTWAPVAAKALRPGADLAVAPARDCPACGGRGRQLYRHSCEGCGGSGAVA